jgi:cytochrome c553
LRTPLILCTAANVALFATAWLPAPSAAQANDPNLARNIAATCAICHGTGGVSQGVVPSLAGTAQNDLASKMQEFKTGKRTGTIMPQLAKGFSDEQIDLVAGWFAAQKK